MAEARSGISIPDDLVNALREADSIAVLTGAGVSAESGIPTFRDARVGLWAQYDPMKLATPQGFDDDPELVTRWYDERRAMIAQCRPNPGHVALAELERRLAMRGGTLTLVTQNIDRLHHQAGSQNVLELHGTIWEWRCTKTGRQREYPEYPFDEYPPRSEAGGLLRPAVVWFGEALPAGVMEAAEHAAFTCDLFFSVGTSAEVYPAAGLIDVAQMHGRARTCEINKDPTAFSRRVTWSIQGKSGEVLPGLVERLDADV